VIAFVTGATGALGAPAVARLRASGHSVRALATNPGSARRLLSVGAEPVETSLFDRAGLAAAVRGADAVLHLATRIAPASRARRRGAWRENDRVRIEGTRNLVDAALATGVGVVVYPSFAPVYAGGGARWLSVGAPVDPTEVLESTLVAEDEVMRYAAAGGRGVVLRMAGVYGPHSAATRDVLALARRGISAFAGPPDAYQSLVWDEDAAAALVVAATAEEVGGAYDVADDEPLTRAALAHVLAGVTGRPVRRLPTWLVRLALGPRMEFLLRSHRVSNRRFTATTGWVPQVRSAADGLAQLARAPAAQVGPGSPGGAVIGRRSP
jgi:nucleoside-diphosphate-sugar epimerase